MVGVAWDHSLGPGQIVVVARLVPLIHVVIALI